jgi:hypothetical protein
LPLFAANQSLALPGWLRWLMRLVVIPLSLAALSPVWTPAILMAPEFRLQTGLALVTLGLVVIAPLFKKAPLKLLVGLFVLAGIPALILPVWQFNLIQAGMGEAYHQPVSLDWGWWVAAGGIVLSAIGGVWAAFLKG